MITTILLQVIDETLVQSGMPALQKVLTKIGFRLLIDIVSVFILVRLVYFPIYKKRDMFFTYFIFNCVIFLICFLLNKVELSMGAAFGLFAVFSMLRYRTEDISLKDMTYLFLVIAMGLIAAVSKIKGATENYELLFLVCVNATLILLTWLLEGKLFLKAEAVKIILYENIELIHTDKRADLIADIKTRTGIEAHKVEIQKIDFLKDEALIKIYYYE
ncbi:MAG: DUF4956 domain-containing protein [Bacteroidia bacterium]